MSKVLAWLGGLILVAVLVVSLVVGATFGYLALYRAAAPGYEAARREVYVNTPSYVQGKVTYLSRLRADYQRARDEETRASLKDLIVTEAATVDPGQLPADLRSFLRSL